MSEFLGPFYSSFGLTLGRGKFSEVFEFVQFPLDFCQLLLGLPKEPGVFHLLAIGQVGKVLESNIYAYVRPLVILGNFYPGFNREHRKPFGPFPFEANSFDLAHDFPVQFNLDSSNFREGQLIVFERPAKLRIGQGVVAVGTLIAGIAGVFSQIYPAKESVKSFVNSVQQILQSLRIDHIHIRTHFFDSRELSALGFETDRFVIHAVGFVTLMQSPVVQFPANRQMLSKRSSLRFGGIYSKLVGFASMNFLLALLVFYVLFESFKSYAAHGVTGVRISPKA